MTQKKLPLINAAHGSDTRNIINELIKLFNGMGYTYDEALKKAHDVLDEAQKKSNNVLTEAERVNAMNESVQQQINTLIAESGTSDSEVVQARIDAEGNSYSVLKSRLDDKDFEVNIQNKKAAKENLKNNVSDTKRLSVASKSGTRPLVTFIDDDGFKEVVTRMKPIFDEKGVKATVAIVSDWVGRESEGNMTRDEVLQLQDDGWEVASHEKTHIPMSSVTDEDIIKREVVDSKFELLQMGFNVKNIVYPFGQTNEKLLDYVSEYYRAGTITGIVSNDSTIAPPISKKRLRRVDFSGEYDLSHYKSVVDKASANNSWVIFMTHLKVQPTSHDQVMSDLIDYIQSLNIDIVTLDEGLDVYDDKISVDGFIRLLPDNTTANDKFVMGLRDQSLSNIDAASDFDTILSKYRQNTVLYTEVNQANSTGFPSNRPGILETQIVADAAGYIRQIYSFYDGIGTFLRVYRSDGTLTDWRQFTTTQNAVIRTPDAWFESNQTRVFDIDVSEHFLVNMTTPFILTPRSTQIEDYSYNARLTNQGILKLRLTRVAENGANFSAADWDLTVIR